MSLLQDKHCLVIHDVQIEQKFVNEFENIKSNFCGRVIQGDDFLRVNEIPLYTLVYLCGNIGKICEKLTFRENVKIVKELSYNFIDKDMDNLIRIGQVPLNLHNMGLYFKEFFDMDVEFPIFENLQDAHQFQILTESNKPTPSFRKGIYLSKVEKVEGYKDAVQFNLLRCSTNLDGPTDMFKSIDNEIVGKVQKIASQFFNKAYYLNHVLAQIYENSTMTHGTKYKEKKARIKSHSDKTKDMPENGLIAFCTFYSKDLYDGSIKKSKDDIFDYVYKDTSVLTRLRFRLKKCVIERDNLEKEFSVVLYPNSVFVIPLSTNRLYTHEIAPSSLSINKIPTRLGYVIRCSKTNAVHKNGETFIDGVIMEKPTESDIIQLKDLYLKENSTDDVIEYGNIYYSMNNGDYEKPNGLFKE